jgi:hypothetical protein
MLKINNIQKKQIKDKQIEEFVESLLPKIKDDFKEDLSEKKDNEIISMIKYYLDDGLKFGIESKMYLEMFIIFCFRYKEMRHERPTWILRILNKPDLDEEIKLEQIHSLVEFGVINEYDEELTQEEEEDAFSKIV